MDYDQQFNLRRRHPMGRAHLLLNELESTWARARMTVSIDVSYGPTEGQKLDIFPAPRPKAPVFVFIHGGYFRALDKRQYSYVARPFFAAGCTTVVINYDLAPKVRVHEIAEQNLRAISWIHQYIGEWHGDAHKIVVCCHSVGAFLVAKILEHPWSAEIAESLRGAFLLSGLYDLEPMRRSYLNDSLHLSEEDARDLSPIGRRTRNFPPTVIAVGADETEEFVRQSRDYSQKLTLDGHEHELMILDGKNHYTVSRMLSRPGNVLLDQMLDVTCQA